MENLYQPKQPVWPPCSHLRGSELAMIQPLTGCYGNPFRHKDHFCVRVVLACSTPQVALVCCIKLSQRFPGWLNITNRPTRPSLWTFPSAAKREKYETPAGDPVATAWLFQSAAFRNESTLSLTDNNLLKITLPAPEISTSEEDYFFAVNIDIFM